MWKRRTLEGKEYLVKHTTNECLHKLHITDLKYLWCEEIIEASLLQRCKEMNRLLEASDAELLNLVWSLVEGEGIDVTSCFTDDINGKQLNLQSNLDGLLKFKVKFILLVADHSQLFEEVTCPLLITVSELEKRQGLLVDIIKKKDLEIAEYKLEGAKISRGTVETQVFDLESFSRKCAEDLGTTKSLIQTQPFCTFTPFIRDMLENTATAVIVPRENNIESDGVLQKSKKTARITFKSSVKAKKSKIYDDEDEISDGEEIKKEQENSSTGSFDKKKEPIKSKPKGNARPKVKKVLSNL